MRKFKILLSIVLFSCMSLLGDAQWSKKDVEWSESGLTSKNYRLVRTRSNANVQIGAVTGSKPAMDATVLNEDGKRLLKITLANRFDYEKSWMMKSEEHDTSLLKHEQGHFDINEIYTRKTFQQFKNFKFTNDFKKEIYTIMQMINKQLLLEQQAYERETVYGTDASGQAKWNQQIADELHAIPSYKDQTIEKELPPRE